MNKYYYYEIWEWSYLDKALFLEKSDVVLAANPIEAMEIAKHKHGTKDFLRVVRNIKKIEE